MLTKVVIFGRSNVGKSTLFNRMAKRRAAIVENVVGVTRDSISFKVNKIRIIGYEKNSTNNTVGMMMGMMMEIPHFWGMMMTFVHQLNVLEIIFKRKV